MIKQKLFKRMVDLMKSRAGHHFSERHRKGKDLEVVIEDHGIFKVSSDTYKDKEYQVEARNLTCFMCRDRCPYCHVCKCMYVCSREDNSQGTKNVCKHIHSVVDFSQNTCLPATPKSPTQEIEMIHDVISNEITVPQPNDYVEKIINSFSQILVPSMKEIKDIEVLKTLDSQLAKMINTAKAAIKYPENNELPVNTSTTNEPVNKNCIKQDQLYTTKKRTREEDGNTLKKPSAKAKLEIGESLLKSQSDGICIPILSKGAVG